MYDKVNNNIQVNLFTVEIFLKYNNINMQRALIYRREQIYVYNKQQIINLNNNQSYNQLNKLGIPDV